MNTLEAVKAEIEAMSQKIKARSQKIDEVNTILAAELEDLLAAYEAEIAVHDAEADQALNKVTELMALCDSYRDKYGYSHKKTKLALAKAEEAAAKLDEATKLYDSRVKASSTAYHQKRDEQCNRATHMINAIMLEFQIGV